LSTTPFRFPPVTSGGDTYDAIPMTNTHQGQATAALVSGGLCVNPAPDTSWQGKVVLCQRGSVSFLQKSQSVASSGGVAAVIYNNTAGPLNGTLGDNLAVIPAIPVVGIAMADGQALLASHLGDSTTVDSVIMTSANGYEFYNGTSMATPHVAGVAALIWSANPTWTNQQVREALDATAEDRGAAGYDTSYGWGLVQAKDALLELQSQ
ncbi:MAG: S8 family serine peptidase, partial [Lysobacter sp.]